MACEVIFSGILVVFVDAFYDAKLQLSRSICSGYWNGVAKLEFGGVCPYMRPSGWFVCVLVMCMLMSLMVS